MRFTTTSGAVYDLLPSSMPEDDDGAARIGNEFRAVIVRDSIIPLIDRNSGRDMPTVHGQEGLFFQPPMIGESFHYWLPTHGYCTTTPVVSIEREPLQ